MGKLAPSILSADFACLGEQAELITRSGADYIHVDVMDGHFVPNISFGAAVMKSLNRFDTAPYDVHLMIENPDAYIADFVTDKTEFIVVHQEACRHLHRTLQNIRSLGIFLGMYSFGSGFGTGDVSKSGIRRSEVHSFRLGKNRAAVSYPERKGLLLQD